MIYLVTYSEFLMGKIVEAETPAFAATIVAKENMSGNDFDYSVKVYPLDKFSTFSISRDFQVVEK